MSVCDPQSVVTTSHRHHALCAMLCSVTQPGYGVYGARSLPCPKGEYNRQDTYSNCTACPTPLTTAGPGAGVIIADCGIPIGYGYHGGSVVQCPIGELGQEEKVPVTWLGFCVELCQHLQAFACGPCHGQHAAGQQLRDTSNATP